MRGDRQGDGDADIHDIITHKTGPDSSEGHVSALPDAMLALRNQKCRIYGDTILIDEPKKKAVIAYEQCGIESPTRLSNTGLDQ